VFATRLRASWRHLSLLGVGLVALLASLVVVAVSPPLGFSPRLGSELDITGFFPRFWRLIPPAASPGQFQAESMAIMIALWLVYGLALRLLWVRSSGRDDNRHVIRVLTVVTVAAHVLLVFAPPVSSSDVFHYALFGRMVNHTNLNPYVSNGYALAPDPILRYATWPELSSHYGPAFTWLSALAASVGGEGVFGTGLAFKGMAALFSLTSCWLVRRLFVQLHGGDGALALAAYAWNPLVLIESAEMGHNETVMVALILGGFLLAICGRPWLGLAMMVVSADIKLLTGAALAMFVVNHVARAPGPRARLARGLGCVAVIALVLLFSWLPFWEHGRAIAGARQLLLDQRRVPGASLGAVRLPLAIGAGVLILFAAVAATRASFVQLVSIAAALMLALVVIFPWRQPWYSLPPLALLAVNVNGRPQVMLFVVAVLWGGMLMFRYALVHPLLFSV
jgi:alpha-1,6-mannosyltransferase